jgi:hypothetical protein
MELLNILLVTKSLIQLVEAKAFFALAYYVL